MVIMAKKDKGVSLAELMIGMVILVTCILLLMGMFSAGSVRMRQAGAVTTASFLAKEKMEEALADPGELDTNGSFTTPFEDYDYDVTVKEYPDDPMLEQIEVTVTTPERLGGKKVKVVMLRAL